LGLHAGTACELLLPRGDLLSSARRRAARDAATRQRDRLGRLAARSPSASGYGARSRACSPYSRELGLFPLEQAVHRMTRIVVAAVQTGRTRRDRRRQSHAYLVVFDPARVIDKSTYRSLRSFRRHRVTVMVAVTVALRPTARPATAPAAFSGGRRTGDAIGDLVAWLPHATHRQPQSATSVRFSQCFSPPALLRSSSWPRIRSGLGMDQPAQSNLTLPLDLRVRGFRQHADILHPAEFWSAFVPHHRVSPFSWSRWSRCSASSFNPAQPGISRGSCDSHARAPAVAIPARGDRLMLALALRPQSAR